MKADNKAENERKRQSEGVTLGRLSPQLHKSQTHTHTECKGVGQLSDRLELCVFVCPRLRTVLQTPQGCFIKLAMSTKADTTTV